MNTPRHSTVFGIRFASRGAVAMAAGFWALTASAQEALDNLAKGNTAAYNRGQQMQDETAA